MEDNVKKLFPGAETQNREGYPTKKQFYKKWAPWILGRKDAQIYATAASRPKYLKEFCDRFHVSLHSNLYASDGTLVTLPSSEVPNWYQARQRRENEAIFSQHKPIYMYFPWIAEHTDALMKAIHSDNYNLVPFDIFADVDRKDDRREVGRFAARNPELYRRMVIRRLVPLRKKIKAFIFTFDWAPVTRIVAQACMELGIPTILVPHESIFVDREKYYWEPHTYASVPTTDIILGWGELQKEIFVGRGFPAEKFITVGAPKFDAYNDYEPQLTRQQFASLFGLDAQKKIILFASQPLDSQLDHNSARESQRRAMSDILQCCEEWGAQLLVRLPPSRDDILGPPLRNALLNSLHGAYDDATCYLVSPEEALYHCDVVASVNSTMLFEGLLLGRPPLSMKYVEFEQIWERAGIPAARNDSEARHLLRQMLDGRWSPDQAGMAWASHALGTGEFDGQAAKRIELFLCRFARAEVDVGRRSQPIEKLLANEPLDVVAVASTAKALGGIQKNLAALVNARSIVSSRDGIDRTSAADIFLQWGNLITDHKVRQRATARMLGKKVAVVEDGFIRSFGIGLSGEPGLSIILDDLTAYYDATRPSRLEVLLQDGPALSVEEIERAKRAIALIVGNKVSKYNHAPERELLLGRPGASKILLIDQRYGDQSIEGGMANEGTFQEMLSYAVSNYPAADIIIKRHPDSISGGKKGHYDDQMLRTFSSSRNRILTLDDDVNPYSVIGVADKVFVVSSGMGFEALMAGKEVHCFGVPFYSGWGVTVDHQTVPRRSRARSVEEIFHFAYIVCSRYVLPDGKRQCDVEELVEFIAGRKQGLRS